MSDGQYWDDNGEMHNIIIIMSSAGIHLYNTTNIMKACQHKDPWRIVLTFEHHKKHKE